MDPFDADYFGGNMHVPNRISMTNDKNKRQSSSYFMRDDLDMERNSTYSMDIPQRILVGGGDSHVELKRDSLKPSGEIADEVLDPSGVTRSENNILQAPPSSMTLSKVHYPDIEEPLGMNVKNVIEDGDPLTSLRRRIDNIQRKVDSMEKHEEARSKREWLMIGTVGLFIIFKMCSFVLGRNS